MAVCPYCGSQNDDANAFCSECGGPLKQEQPPVAPEPPVQQNTPFSSLTNQQPTYTAPIQNVEPIPTGGLMAWSIITILLCTIPGIVALVQTLGINKSVTVEEQQKKMSTARTWCIVGTILGILALIGTIAQNR